MLDLIGSCERYLRDRTGCYEYRAIRYRAAIEKMTELGLNDESIVVDLGAGWTELDYCLRAEYGWRGRYLPIDGGLDGTDLDRWTPRCRYDFFVALEVLEHLGDPSRLLKAMRAAARLGCVVSVPNPRTTDVLGMDPTHITVIGPGRLLRHGFTVEERSFYGQAADSLFGWRAAD